MHMDKYSARKYGKKKNKQLSEASFAYTKDSGVVKIGTSHNLKKATKKAASKAARRAEATSNHAYKKSYDVAWTLH